MLLLLLLRHAVPLEASLRHRVAEQHDQRGVPNAVVEANCAEGVSDGVGRLHPLQLCPVADDALGLVEGLLEGVVFSPGVIELLSQ